MSNLDPIPEPCEPDCNPADVVQVSVDEAECSVCRCRRVMGADG